MKKQIFLIMSFVLIFSFSLVSIAKAEAMGKTKEVKKSEQRADTERIKKWNWGSRKEEDYKAISRKLFVELPKKDKFSKEDIEFMEEGLRQKEKLGFSGKLILYVLGPDDYRDTSGKTIEKKDLPRNKQCITILKKIIKNKWTDNNTQLAYAIDALSSYGEQDTSIIPFLKKIAATETDLDVIAACGKALYKLGEKKIGYAIYEELAKKGGCVAKPGGFDFRGDTNSKELREMLFRAITYDNSPCAQAFAMWHLALFGEYETLSDVYLKLKNRLENGDIKDEEINHVENALNWTKDLWRKQGR